MKNIIKYENRIGKQFISIAFSNLVHLLICLPPIVVYLLMSKSQLFNGCGNYYFGRIKIKQITIL